MRIGASLLLKNGYCYQSYRWKYLRPLGSLVTAIKYLERRNVDEISIIRYCRRDDNLQSLEKDLELISNIDCMTPLSFGGGIRDSSILHKLHVLPIERILINSSFIERDEALLSTAIRLFGKQALVAVLPYRVVDGRLEYFHSRLNNFSDCDLDFVQQYSNEVMFYNTNLEGSSPIHPQHIFDFPLPNSKIILSGGINRALILQAKKLNFSAISFDNSSLHKEFNFSEL